jgi:hypothetical protein
MQQSRMDGADVGLPRVAPRFAPRVPGGRAHPSLAASTPGSARLGRLQQAGAAPTRRSPANEEGALRWHWGNRAAWRSAAIEKPHWPAGARSCRAISIWPTRADGARSRARAASTLLHLDLEERFRACCYAAGHRAGRAASGGAAAALRASAPLSPRVARVALLGTAPGWFEMLGVRMKGGVAAGRCGCRSDRAGRRCDDAALMPICKTAGRRSFCRDRHRAAARRDARTKDELSVLLDVPNWPIARDFPRLTCAGATRRVRWLYKGGDGLQVAPMASSR